MVQCDVWCSVMYGAVQCSVQYSAVQCAVLCVIWSDEYFILHLCLSYLELFFLLYLCFFFFFLLSILLYFPFSLPSPPSHTLLLPSPHSLLSFPHPIPPIIPSHSSHHLPPSPLSLPPAMWCSTPGLSPSRGC